MDTSGTVLNCIYGDRDVILEYPFIIQFCNSSEFGAKQSKILRLATLFQTKQVYIITRVIVLFLSSNLSIYSPKNPIKPISSM